MCDDTDTYATHNLLLSLKYTIIIGKITVCAGEREEMCDQCLIHFHIAL